MQDLLAWQFAGPFRLTFIRPMLYDSQHTCVSVTLYRTWQYVSTWPVNIIVSSQMLHTCNVVALCGQHVCYTITMSCICCTCIAPIFLHSYITHVILYTLYLYHLSNICIYGVLASITGVWIICLIYAKAKHTTGRSTEKCIQWWGARSNVVSRVKILMKHHCHGRLWFCDSVYVDVTHLSNMDRNSVAFPFTLKGMWGFSFVGFLVFCGFFITN